MNFIKNQNYQQAVVNIEELMWDRVSYNEKASNQRKHNHAFIHTPVCTRFATVTLNREGKLFLTFEDTYLSYLKHVQISTQTLSAASRICVS